MEKNLFSCLFPLDGMEKRASDASGGVVGGAACSEQKKLKFGTII
jgi:hypothetical protein